MSMIYLAPLQGFTEVFYRRAFADTIGGIDKFFTPFFEFNSRGQFEAPNPFELDHELNSGLNVVPQMVAQNGEELVAGASYFYERGYNEVNLNLGCPFPMLVKRRKGCGALPYTDDVVQILNFYFEQNLPIKLSIKTRLGLDECADIYRLLPYLNKMDIAELIIHFRLGKDQYKGEVRWDEFDRLLSLTNLPIVPNGDIVSYNDLMGLQHRFPSVEKWMIGRGVLTNPLLPRLCKGEVFTHDEQVCQFLLFHDNLVELLNKKESDVNRYTNVVKGFWHYHANFYTNKKKIHKVLQKVRTASDYTKLASQIRQLVLEDE